MRSDTFTLDRTGGQQVAGYRWLPDDDAARAVVVIAHGMAEHASRYARFASALTGAGYAVYAQDHRGHGRTAELGGAPGVLAERDGFETVVDDLHGLVEHARQEQPGLPVVLFGHSMGSFLMRRYVQRHHGDTAALVVCGTASDPGALGRVGRTIALGQSRLRGRGHPSGLMTSLTFGGYNRPFRPNRTDFDWLSRDDAEVDAYVADPWCGRACSAGFYVDLLGGLATINSEVEAARTPTGLPVLVISGTADPVGGDGKGVRAVAEQLQRVGVSAVTLRLYPQARHELLNETDRDEVTADILSWLDDALTTPA